MILSILTVLMLVTISYATAIENKSYTENKESPLYKIRTKNAIGEKIGEIISQIKTKFLGERLFWLPKSFLFFTKDESVLILQTPAPHHSICCTKGPTFVNFNCGCAINNEYSKPKYDTVKGYVTFIPCCN